MSPIYTPHLYLLKLAYLWKNGRHHYTSYGLLQVIDSNGYRPNVGIILSNSHDKVFWCRRIGQNAWQFPQGGVKSEETPEQAMYRELEEETGLLPNHVAVIGTTKGWLKYKLPEKLVRRNTKPICIGQKQRWFILRLLDSDEVICLDKAKKPEFDRWRWVDYWHPLKHIVNFKRNVYRQALTELEMCLKR